MKEYYNEGDIRIYNCDNIDLLRELPSRSINLIYCDILYNSGKRFRDYNDDLGSPAEAVEWYRPRLIEMRRVLANNGSIFIHCNWRLDSYIRVLMDEIFGINCFRNRISRRHSKERYFFANFDSQMDCILYYVKDAKNFVFNETRDSTERVAPLFEIGYIEARSKAYNLSGKSIDLSSKNMHWLISEEQFNIMVSNNEIQLINGLPYRFSNVKPIGNLWDEPEMLDTYMRTELDEAYDTPKPEAILERIISTCSKEGDTVADFFMGGGTTAVVAKRLNRVGIFCDISEKACDVTVKKLSNTK